MEGTRMDEMKKINIIFSFNQFDFWDFSSIIYFSESPSRKNSARIILYLIILVKSILITITGKTLFNVD